MLQKNHGSDAKSEQIKTSEEKKLTDAIIKSIPGVFYIFDESGKFLRWNESIKKITGYSDKEIASLTAITLIAEEDRALIIQGIKDCFIKGESKNEAQILTKKNKKIPFLFCGNSMELDGKKYIVGTGFDISILKKAESDLHLSEEKYRTMIEETLDIIFRMDARGNIIYMSPQIQKYGFKPEEMTNHNILEFIAKEDEAEITSIFKKTLAGIPHPPAEFRFKDKKGNVFWQEETGRLLKDKSGVAICISGVIRDITERKKTEEEIKKRNAELERFGKIAVDRELKMIELKKEIENLKKK